jgi:hypothetical protein
LDSHARPEQNTYTNESFIDELAAVVGMDPLDFRLKCLDPADQARHRGAAATFPTFELAKTALTAKVGEGKRRQGPRYQRINLSTDCHEVDWLGEKGFGTSVQCPRRLFSSVAYGTISFWPSKAPRRMM